MLEFFRRPQPPAFGGLRPPEVVWQGVETPESHYVPPQHAPKHPEHGAMTVETKTPAELGYAMPAEWEWHEATWLAWPRYVRDWPGKMGAVAWAFGEMVRKIAPAEKVRICVDSKDAQARARRVLEAARAEMAQVEFFRIPTERAWMRDTGPIFVQRSADGRRETAVVDFHFNAWARYDDWQRDHKVSRKAAKALGLPRHEALWDTRKFVLEGGGVEVNGRGTVLTTEECYLDPQVQVRNPGADRNVYQRVFAECLGASHTLWLGGGLAGDDTHGHVDDLCRFVGPRTVVAVRCNDPADENYRALADNFERLRSMRVEDGSPLEVVALPAPAPLCFRDRRLPASYANFYIANAAVLVPTFNDPADRLALGILAELFPGRAVVGIHAVDLVLGSGAIHCLTQQQPANSS